MMNDGYCISTYYVHRHSRFYTIMRWRKTITIDYLKQHPQSNYVCSLFKFEMFSCMFHLLLTITIWKNSSYTDNARRIYLYSHVIVYSSDTILETPYLFSSLLPNTDAIVELLISYILFKSGTCIMCLCSCKKSMFSFLVNRIIYQY
jgi:hypothetical protein